MEPVVAPQVSKPTVHQIVAWAAWAGFLLASIALFLVARHVKDDTYFVAYYNHNPMSQLTVVMTTFPVWMLVLPFLWLPFVIGYQRQNNPKWLTLLFLSASMFMASVVVFVLLLCSGPPFEM